jgi:nickel/cobalt exporter
MFAFRLVALFVVLISTALVSAHPLPSFQFDRNAVVRFANDGVEIDYTLELSLFAMALDSRGLFTREEEQQIGGRQKEFAAAYAAKKAPLIADELRVRLGEADAKLTSRVVAITFEDTHVRFAFRFTSPWPGERSVRFQLEDQSFEDKPGVIHWSFAKDTNGITFKDVVEPIDLASKAPLELTREQAQRRRILAAAVERPAATTPLAEPVIDSPVAISGADQGLFGALAERGLVALFDSKSGMGLLLLAAAIFGMAHAVTPGHGKTLVAAYLVGEKGTVGHAVVLGLSTTLAHTGSVIILAIILAMSYRDGVPDEAKAILQIAGGMLILLVGLWLLLQRLRGRADHVHLKVGSKDEAKKSRLSWLRVVLLGMAGGMIPCWDAVLLLLVAISAGRLAFAVPLLIAFSVGLSAVLVALGIGVVWAARAGGRSFGESRWFKLLPTLSAALLVIIGVWFVRDAFHMFDGAAKETPAASKG